jgi:hypothetical protein
MALYSVSDLQLAAVSQSSLHIPFLFGDILEKWETAGLLSAEEGWRRNAGKFVLVYCVLLQKSGGKETL